MKIRSPIVVASVALLAAGCGSAKPPSSTGLSSSNDPATAAFRYADCMRLHGATGLPDPRVRRNGNQISVIQQLPSSVSASPRFKSAEHACQGIIPAPSNVSPRDTAQRRQAFLAFAGCMRAHGVSDFPDPTPQGQITSGMLSASGVDLHSRLVLDAALGCVGVTHGLITAADVHTAVSGH